ncbi:hypothetical protein NMY22_g8566 [Coprinellus aureogranulatus]|nr:hypothetical protein NMY22_g8566 [Coprinellus aureogranulatus]
MVELPQSIIPLVLKEVCYSSKVNSSHEHQPNLKHLLRSCALVNSAWRKPAQTLLFESVVCNPRFVRTFLRKDGDDSKSSLLQHVRTIDFFMPVHHVDPHALDESGKCIGLALERCSSESSLYEIVLRGGGDNTFSEVLLSDIRKRFTSQTSASSLRCLRVYWRDPRTTFPYRVASYFPSLQFLSISVYGDDEYTRLCGPRPPTNALTGLSLSELRLSGTLPSAVAMLRHVPSTLRVLELPSFLDHLDVVMPDLLPHYSSLRSLRLRRFTHTERLLVELCPNLEELMVFPGRKSEDLPVVLQPSLRHLLLMLSWSSLWGQRTPPSWPPLWLHAICHKERQGGQPAMHSAVWNHMENSTPRPLWSAGSMRTESCGFDSRVKRILAGECLALRLTCDTDPLPQDAMCV